MQHQTTTASPAAATELAARFNSNGYGLTANGQRVLTDGRKLVFTAGALAYLREHVAEHEDGHVTFDNHGHTIIWIGGDGYPVEPVTR